jgi:hypothetical protein
MSHEQSSGERVVEIPRLEISEFTPGQQLLITLGNSRSRFHAIVTDPEKGEAVVRPWVGGGQRNAGYPDARTTIGTRPYEEGRETSTEEVGEQEVAWGGITFGDELVMRNEEGTNKIIFTGEPVESVEAAPQAA